MKWIFVRHGETKDNIGRVFAGHTDSKLSEKGERQVKFAAKKLHQKLKDREQVSLYSSPLNRTKVLAEAVERNLNQDRKSLTVSCSFMEALKEVHFGVFEGLKQQEIESRYPREWQLLMENYGNYSIPGGETLEAFHNRVVHGFEIIRSQGSEKEIKVIITHGGVIQSALIYFLDLPLESRWHFSIPNAGIVEIEVIEGFGILKSICPPRDEDLQEPKGEGL